MKIQRNILPLQWDIPRVLVLIFFQMYGCSTISWWEKTTCSIFDILIFSKLRTLDHPYEQWEERRGNMQFEQCCPRQTANCHQHLDKIIISQSVLLVFTSSSPFYLCFPPSLLSDGTPTLCRLPFWKFDSVLKTAVESENYRREKSKENRDYMRKEK